jgi:nitrite reductase/ring-hydroxylating ferredoxin subunit
VSAALHLAGLYRRRVHASLPRIWENVFDWEHLPHLHAGSFAECRLIERGGWGWRAALRLAGREDEQVIELRADRAANLYVTTTLAGAGEGSEIRVALMPVEPHVVDVQVEFHLPEANPERLAAIGQAYAAVYARLWDEDEAMMQAREAALACAHPSLQPGVISLGGQTDVRRRLPFVFEHSGARFRLIELDGTLVAHSVVCPHWLGPLDKAEVQNGAIACPWHGYRFDLRSGACLGRPGLALNPAPAIRLRDGQVEAVAS